MSPAIFLTDDHKAKPTKPDGIELKHLPPSLANIANGPGSGSQAKGHSNWGSAASSVPASSQASSQASSVASSAVNSAVPSRSNSVEALGSMLDNDGGGGNASGAAAGQSVRSKKDRANGTGKPYNLDTRPTANKAKRGASMNRLNNFAMTPLSKSAPGSPRHGMASPLAAMTSLPPDYFHQANGALQNYAEAQKQGASAVTSTGTVRHGQTNPGNLSVAGAAGGMGLGTAMGTINPAGLVEHASPLSSISAPSTPGGGSLESYSSSFQHGGFGAGSITSSDDFASTGTKSVEQSPLYPSSLPLPQNMPFAGGMMQQQQQQQPPLSQHQMHFPISQQMQFSIPSTSNDYQDAGMSTPQPKIGRMIPNEGPMHGEWSRF